jgi:multidrug efflux pump subunit AcrA (membrane-fusion protein)
VVRDGDLAAVWVEDEPTLFRRRQVTLGMEQEGRVQIRNGLGVGERIVARGFEIDHSEQMFSGLPTIGHSRDPSRHADKRFS